MINSSSSPTHEEIDAYSHALVQLDVLTDRTLTGNGEALRIRWFDRLPVRTGGRGAKVEFRSIEPPFSLSLPDAAGGARRLDDLEPQLKRDINQALEDLGLASGVDFSAPIAPLVWEHVFESERFREGE